MPDLPPQENPWAPGFNPLEPPAPGPPQPVPYPFTPGLPTLDPGGDGVRGPSIVQRPDHTNPVPPGAPSPDVPVPAPVMPPSVPGPADPPLKPWEKPNERIVFDPQRGTWRDRRPHINMPPLSRTKEIKPPYMRVQVPAVQKLGEATEYCDLVDSLFDALPIETQAKYDSTKFLRKARPNLLTENRGIPSLVSEAAKGNWGHYKTGVKKEFTGRKWHQAREAFNARNAAEPDPLMRSKWGRKASCQVKARAVYENAHELANDKAMEDIFWNIIANEAEDRGIGKLGQGSAQHSKQTGRWLGWGSRGL